MPGYTAVSQSSITPTSVFHFLQNNYSLFSDPSLWYFYYGGKAAISLVAPCPVVAAVVDVAEGCSRLSLNCTGFDRGTANISGKR
jgi:hypothetical protein